MDNITADGLIDACRDDALDAGLRIRTRLEPLGGDGAPVKPPIYASTNGQPPTYQIFHRWRGEGDDRRQVLGVAIDSVPSQANRVEHELARIVDDVGLPELRLSLEPLAPLPAHLPAWLSSYTFPHRGADAYLRDALLEGEALPRTDIGKAILNATADDPGPLLAWFPHSLALGWWQSHLGRKGSQAKLARSWVSEIVGVDPAVADPDSAFETPRTSGMKGDALNLSSEEPITRNPDDGTVWTIGKAKEGAATERTKLSEIGHGQVPFSGNDGTPAPLSFSEIEQTATLSVPGLRRIWAGDPDRSMLARAVAAATVLLGYARAHGRPFTLRSGCDLRPTEISWTWLGSDVDRPVEALTPDAARTLFDEVVARASAGGLPVGADHWTQIDLTPNEQLAKAIRSTYPVAD